MGTEQWTLTGLPGHLFLSLHDLATVRAVMCATRWQARLTFSVFPEVGKWTENWAGGRILEYLSCLPLTFEATEESQVTSLDLSFPLRKRGNWPGVCLSCSQLWSWSLGDRLGVGQA